MHSTTLRRLILTSLLLAFVATGCSNSKTQDVGGQDETSEVTTESSNPTTATSENGDTEASSTTAPATQDDYTTVVEGIVAAINESAASVSVTDAMIDGVVSAKVDEGVLAPSTWTVDLTPANGAHLVVTEVSAQYCVTIVGVEPVSSSTVATTSAPVAQVASYVKGTC